MCGEMRRRKKKTGNNVFTTVDIIIAYSVHGRLIPEGASIELGQNQPLRMRTIESASQPKTEFIGRETTSNFV